MTLRPESAAQSAQRSVADRCPGVFATHSAADGPLARIRLPGGALRADQLQTLATAAADYGDGYLELTGRGNIQLRAIADVDAVAALIADSGLVHDSTTDRQRNIVASPLSGRIDGIADIRAIVAELDDALNSGAAPESLSRRFWFGLDAGHTDVIAQRPDVALLATAADQFDVVLGGHHVGSTSATAAVDVLLDVARQFVAAAPDAWRVSDIDARLFAAIRSRVAATLEPPTHDEPLRPAVRSPLVGWFAQDDGRVLLGATTPLGRLPARTAEFLAAIGAPLIVTPHREIVICDLGEGVADTVVRVLAPMGLIFDANSPWTLASSCAGAPGCAKALAPVREHLAALVESTPDAISEPEHWVGCERACGTPTHAHTRVQAVPDGADGAITYRRTPMS
ncbi:precorrin-3B synthase [Gordonia effusa NBRC 100432]|uniref:Precorrin-3B synthase n=1 Tax=Gordonia effusa NBRC 100432 TaxID=1077974 RepID=H0R075_9ACTN|nr:precorrin-3B synthase [Gordonia effusa]GAB18476.1 precorrin-3B synthase [Gordonia effusa NBRC 100432]